MGKAPKRYEKMTQLIQQVKPKTILEIGTWSGDRAMQLVQDALQYQPEVHYIGYDLFEDATPETDREELNVKRHFSTEQVNTRLENFRKKTRLNFSWELIKGNTRETLTPQVVDFAFVDGGHSLETIESDWEAVKNSKMVVFDDYYLPDENNLIPDVEHWGANKIVERIGATVFTDTNDRVKEGGYVTLAVYTAG